MVNGARRYPYRTRGYVVCNGVQGSRNYGVFFEVRHLWYSLENPL